MHPSTVHHHHPPSPQKKSIYADKLSTRFCGSKGPWNRYNSQKIFAPIHHYIEMEKQSGIRQTFRQKRVKGIFTQVFHFLSLQISWHQNACIYELAHKCTYMKWFQKGCKLSLVVFTKMLRKLLLELWCIYCFQRQTVRKKIFLRKNTVS